MPPKMVMCCICGKEVMKAQTYATGETDEEGNPLRACKEHEGVAEKAKELKEKSLKDLKRSMDESPFPGVKQHGLGLGSQHSKHFQQKSLEKEKRKLEEEERFREWSVSHCWCCELPGIHLRDFFQLKLIAMEKGKMLGVNNPLSPEMGKVVAGLMEQMGAKCVLHAFDLDEKLFEKYKEWKNRIHWKCRPIVEFANTIQICFDCQKRTGIEFDLEAHLPKPALKTLAIVGATYEGSGAQKAAQVLGWGSIMKEREEEVKRAENN